MGAALMLPLTLAGCGSARDASKGNFEATLQGWFDEKRECVPIGDMPARVRTDAAPRTRALYGTLAQAGLLTVESRREQAALGSGRSYDYLIYRPVDEGEKAIRKAPDGFLSRFELCFARRQVTHVVEWTEPGDVAGLRMSQVRYRYRIEDVAPWAETPAIRAVLPAIGKVVDAPEGEDKASMVLTSEGWRNARTLQK